MSELQSCAHRVEKVGPARYRCTHVEIDAEVERARCLLCPLVKPMPYVPREPARNGEPDCPPEPPLLRFQTCQHRSRALRNEAGEPVYRDVKA